MIHPETLLAAVLFFVLGYLAGRLPTLPGAPWYKRKPLAPLPATTIDTRPLRRQCTARA